MKLKMKIKIKSKVFIMAYQPESIEKDQAGQKVYTFQPIENNPLIIPALKPVPVQYR